MYADRLGTPLRNVRRCWGAYNPDLNVVILRLWKDEISNGEILVSRAQDPKGRWAHSERNEHLDLMRCGAQGLAILCESSDHSHDSIDDFDEDNLLILGDVRSDSAGDRYAPITGQLAVADFDRWAEITEITKDINEVESRRDIGPTERENLAKARLGQGKFRRELMRRWDHRCAVTGCGIAEILRASHAKPWRRSTDRERMDPDNGLLLTATLDALFDCGLIGFDKTGGMHISAKLTLNQRQELCLPQPLVRRPTNMCANYLAEHMSSVFKAT